MSNRSRPGGHNVRPNVAVISGVIVAVLLVAAVYDASTVGIASMAALGSMVVVPLVAAFVNVVLGHKPPTYPKDAMVPALATFGSVIGVSLAFGGWGVMHLREVRADQQRCDAEGRAPRPPGLGGLGGGLRTADRRAVAERDEERVR